MLGGQPGTRDAAAGEPGAGGPDEQRGNDAA